MTMMKKFMFLMSAIVLVMCLTMTSCSRPAAEETAQEAFTEETAVLFTPIEITEDYDGPILGVEKWHAEKGAYAFLFISDDNGEVFASCTGRRSIYLADLSHDGQPELVCNGSWGIARNNYTTVYKLEEGVISFADASDGEDYLGPPYYANFARANGLDINNSNYTHYSDVYDPERNMIIVTDSSTGTEYEYKWEYLEFHTQAEIDERIAVESNTAPSEINAGVSSDIIDIPYTAAAPSVSDISDREIDITFRRDGKRIDGKLFLPEGKGPFPAVILSCGLSQPYTDYVSKATAFAENGYAAVVFSFIDYSDPAFDIHDIGGDYASVFLSEAADLNTAIDSLGYLPKVDTDSIWLWGHSFGGLVSTYIGCIRSDEIDGIIAVEPALDFGDGLAFDTDPVTTLHIYSLMSETTTNMMIFVGTHDGFGDVPGAFDAAISAMPSADLITVDGADHQFTGKAEAEMVKIACEYLDHNK